MSRSGQRSKIVPYIDGEDASDRHYRRKEINVRQASELSDWCTAHGIQLTIHNDGHHWIFKSGNKIAEWWPSSAKLVKGKKWGRDWHIHDYQQVKEWLMGHGMSSTGENND